MSSGGRFVEVNKPASKQRPPRRLGPWAISTWLSWIWWIGITVFIFHDGVPYWLVAIVLSIAALMAVMILGGMAWRRTGPEAQRPIRRISALIDEAFTAGGTPLGTTVRRWTVGLFTAALLFGLPSYGGLAFVPAGWPRIAVLVLAPVALWIALIWTWKSWRPDRDGEVHFGRAVAGLTAGVLLVGSVLLPSRPATSSAVRPCARPMVPSVLAKTSSFRDSMASRS